MEIKSLPTKVRIEDLPDIGDRSTERVTAAVPREVKEKLDILRAKGKNPSALIRALLEAFFKDVEV
jgi:predicted DNA-binding protein